MIDGADVLPVLVVEDEFLVANELARDLADAGFEVIGIAASADAAIELARFRRPAFAIMDIRIMGPRDGIDVALELLTTFGIRSIFATAHGDEKTRARAAQAQPLGWLQKPYHLHALLTVVREATRQLLR